MSKFKFLLSLLITLGIGFIGGAVAWRFFATRSLPKPQASIPRFEIRDFKIDSNGASSPSSLYDFADGPLNHAGRESIVIQSPEYQNGRLALHVVKTTKATKGWSERFAYNRVLIRRRTGEITTDDWGTL